MEEFRIPESLLKGEGTALLGTRTLSCLVSKK